MTTKPDLRRAALARRGALTAAGVAKHSELVSAQLFQYFPVAKWQRLHVFLPLVSKNELDTWVVIRHIWAEKMPVRLATSVIQPDGISLRHYELTAATPLVVNYWGIPEPVGTLATEVAPAVFDAILVPLLACDVYGQRVGYGGGFYDRFLAQCRPGTVFVGLNILDEPPEDPLADVLPTDVALTALVTPAGMWRF